MTSAHIIYIPLVAIGGIVVGFWLGARAVRDAVNMERRREQQRVEARRKREERKAKKARGDDG